MSRCETRHPADWRGGAAHRPHLARLPPYAPKLNPDEGIWQDLKHVALRNLCCPTLWDLDQEVRLAARRLRRNPHIIRACFAQAGCLQLLALGSVGRACLARLDERREVRE